MNEWGDESIKLHSRLVIECCIGMIHETNLDKDIFYIAGWIHDIGKKVDEDNHQIVGIDYMESFLKTNPQFAHMKEFIADCIAQHRNNGNPKTIYGKIFQIADKVSLHKKEWVAFKGKTPEDEK